MTTTRRQFLVTGGALTAACLLPGCGLRQNYQTDVLVLGAGFSGLLATRLLRSAGIDSILVEGRDRVGGRVHTLGSLPARPEAGATEMGNSYHELLKLCEEFGIQADPITNYPSNYALSVEGRLMSSTNWSDSASNSLPARERNISPHRLLYRFMPRHLPIEVMADWGSQAWIKQDISLADYLRREGASETAISLMGANLNGNDIETLSWADMLKALVVRKNSEPPGTFRVPGGLFRVSRKLQADIQSALLLERPISKIAADRDGVKITCAEGTTLRAKLAICTLPFSTLRNIAIDANFSEAKKAAILGLQYTPVTRIFMGIKSNFWERDGLPENTWTDTALGRIFVTNQKNTPAMASIFSMGKPAVELDAMLEKGIQPVLDLLHRVRPSTRGALEFWDRISWGTDPMSLGAFSHYPAGSIGQYATAVAKPEARVIFAGEHTQSAVPGVEAALVSGRRAAELAQKMLLASRKAA